MSQSCKVFYNFDPAFIGTVPPKGDYRNPITKEHVESFAEEVSGRGVDAFFCCPTMLRRKLWDSQFDPHWTKEAPYIKEPDNAFAWEWDDKLYFRMRRYILSGGKPLDELYAAVRRNGMKFFFTYRMNDCHYLEKSTSHIHDTFWKEHPEYRIGDYGGEHPNMHTQLANLLQNYMQPPVRHHYLNILDELFSLYDADGLELDFMRKPCLVPLPQIDEGREVLTGFIRDVRALLNKHGKKRGKYLPLCVRVPHSPQACYALAMDVLRWDSERLIDMINTSTSFLTNPFALDISGFREAITHARLYGEMHYSLAYGKKWTNYGRRFIRNTTKEQYETAAFYLTGRGADGVSLFNFTGSRQHEFYDPRAAAYPGAEPPLDALNHLGDQTYLARCPKHYVINRFIVDGKEYPNCAVPAKDDLNTTITLYETSLSDNYADGVLRIETESSNRHLPISATINGVELNEFVGTGELFAPVSIEGLSVLENLRYYRVPIDILKTGENTLSIHNEQKTHPKDFVTFTCVELALHPNK